MMSSHRAALAVLVFAIGLLFLLVGIVLAAHGAALDVRFARVSLFAGVTILTITAVVSVEWSVLRAGRRRVRAR